ncbi:hypothetical protein [Amphibacillus sediminis]|uniref:hypothetical protein n=1 Tax=Amphibacillus sediminis TaxID=360185 RepID=UPI00082F40C8|nr:hypothetical protein [Amphibacillus sediminis]
MNNQVRSRKLRLTTDLYKILMTWTLWYIPIVTIGSIIASRFDWFGLEFGNFNFFFVIFRASKAFMVLTSIIIFLYFFNHFIKNGLTRREFFWASTIAAVGVAISITIIASVLEWLLTMLNWTEPMPELSVISLPTWAIGLMMTLILLSSYFGGWLIAVAFYRFKLFGILFIPVGQFLLILIEFLWEGETSLLDLMTINNPSPSLPFALSGTVVLIGLSLWIIRLLTKRVAIKPD